MKYNSHLSQNSNIGELVRKAESDFTSGTTHVSKYVDISLYEDVQHIYAYLESKYTSGDTERPFFNISLAARNIWYRATDLDRNNIRIRPTKSQDDIGAFLATIHLRDWMRREDFGTFLNSWGINSAGFNESVLKFVEQGDKLTPSVVPWNRIICDSIDFASNPKIEILELTEAQLRKNKAYDQELVDKLCTALTARETVAREKKDNKNNYIKLYEVHGELPKSYLTGNEDDQYEYVQQMHVISFVVSKEKGDFDDFTLYSGKEAKDPYMLTALIPEIDGSIALRGSVKTLFDAQWMQNDTAVNIRNQLNLSSKILFQTSDATFVGQNALNALQTGDVLIHKVNEPITMLNNKADIGALQAFSEQWKALGNEITGISESMLGQTAPSGTAWRQVETLLQENHSLFELMTENKGLSVEKMLREYVIPHIKKKMDTSKEIAATLQAHDINRIDAKYIKNYSIQKSNEMIREKVLNGEGVTPEEQDEFTAGYAQEAKDTLMEQGTQRFFAPSEIDDVTWKEIFKDLEWDVEADITNESFDKDALVTLNTLFGIVTDPVRSQMLNSPKGKFILNRILELTGAASPVELSSIQEDMPIEPPAESTGGEVPIQPIQQ